MPRGGAEYDAMVVWIWEQLDAQAGSSVRLELERTDKAKEGLPLRDQVRLVFGERALGSIEALMIASFALGVALK